MPQASRNQKQKARIKRELNNYKRSHENLVQALRRNTTVIMLLLQQAGGTVEISEGVGQTVLNNLGNLSFELKEPTEEQKGLVFTTAVLNEKTDVPVAEKKKKAITITYPDRQEAVGQIEGQSPDSAVVD